MKKLLLISGLLGALAVSQAVSSAAGTQCCDPDCPPTPTCPCPCPPGK